MTTKEMMNKVCEIADLCENTKVKTKDTLEISYLAVDIINQYSGQDKGE